MPCELRKEVVFIFLQLCVPSTYKKESEVAGSAFDGGWGTRWWWDVDGGAGEK